MMILLNRRVSRAHAGMTGVSLETLFARARTIDRIDDRSSWLEEFLRGGEKNSPHVANSYKNQSRISTYTLYTSISRDFSHFDRSLAPLAGQLSFEFLPVYVRLSTRVYDFSIDVPTYLVSIVIDSSSRAPFARIIFLSRRWFYPRAASLTALLSVPVFWQNNKGNATANDKKKTIHIKKIVAIIKYMKRDI